MNFVNEFWLIDVTFGNSGWPPPGKAALSTEGSEWVVHTTATSHFLYDVAGNDLSYVAVGDFGTILQASQS